MLFLCGGVSLDSVGRVLRGVGNCAGQLVLRHRLGATNGSWAAGQDSLCVNPGSVKFCLACKTHTGRKV